MPHDPRYLGGIHYGLLIVFASHASRKLQNVLASTRSAVVGCTIFLLPWLAIQSYYAKQFVPVSLGLEKAAFFERYIALYNDFVKLDRLIPKDTVILSEDYRLSSVYVPRPIFFDPSDLPPGKRTVVLLFGHLEAQRGASISGLKLGEVIYSNPRAVIATYRTPGRSPITDWIQVIQLQRE